MRTTLSELDKVWRSGDYGSCGVDDLGRFIVDMIRYVREDNKWDIYIGKVKELEERNRVLRLPKSVLGFGDNPTVSEVRVALEKVHMHLSELEEFRCEVIRVERVLKESMNDVGVLMSCLEQFVMNPGTCGGFKSLADRRRFFEMYSPDREYVSTLLRDGLRILELVWDSVRGRIFMLTQMDQSVKILSRVSIAEGWVNQIQSSTILGETERSRAEDILSLDEREYIRSSTVGDDGGFCLV